MSVPFAARMGKPPMPESVEPYAKRLKTSPSARRDREAAKTVDEPAEIIMAAWQTRDTSIMKSDCEDSESFNERSVSMLVGF